jgi:hypothetical protein
MVPNFISLLIDQMRGTSHESQTAWVGCLDRRTNQSCPHRRTHQSCYNRHGEHINPGRHGEHINPGLTGEHINPATTAMENTSIQASQENTSILLQPPWRTHQSRPHRRTNHPATQESESSCSTRERIILSHKRANHLVLVRTTRGG